MTISGLERSPIENTLISQLVSEMNVSNKVASLSFDGKHLEAFNLYCVENDVQDHEIFGALWFLTKSRK